MSADREDVSVAGCTAALSAVAYELDHLSKGLAEVERRLEPIQEKYDDGLADYEAGLFKAYEDGEGKWPGEDTRERLYRRQLDRDLRREYDRLHASRKRMEKRIRTLSTAADAQRSVLSALKVELEATGAR
jgi:cell division protein FtsB